MKNSELEHLRYPIGKFFAPDSITPSMRESFLSDVDQLPHRMREAIEGLNASQIATPYRDGGWNPHQVAHHVADSHMNAFIRFKLALTEDVPTICAYDQTRWAELADVKTTPVQASLTLLDSVHARWVNLMRAMNDADFAREYYHPEHKKNWRLDAALALYSWHSRHHVAQINGLRERKGW